MPLLLLALLSADPAAWRDEGVVDGVKLELRPVDGSPFEEARLTTTTDAPLAAVCDAILGKTAKPGEAGGVKKRVLIKATDTDRWTYEQVAIPVVSDRDYVLHVHVVTPASEGRCELTVTTEDDPAFPPQAGHVRLKRLTGRWRVAPNAQGALDVTYEVHSDPGGSVPAVFTRLGSKRAVVDALKVVLTRAKQAP